VETPFEAGDHVVLIDQRDRTYLFELRAGATYHTHGGTLAHDDLIGQPEGTRVTTARGMVLVAFRPRFADFVMKMPRGAQVIYPKDLGPILTFGDIRPGARVIEAGTGSGALSMALRRAVGDQGSVVSYEVRPEHRERAIANIEGFFGKVPENLELREGDIAEIEGSSERFDRAVLDLPEPWRALGPLRTVLEAGATVCAYLPTTVQIQQLVTALPSNGFQHLETFETMKRGWHVTDRSVRPEHRMQGHTGFLTIARLVSAPE
jgi:tRNA (adenine57-N1/adenine58-N1)-methyltransferase catalytic subunit